MGQELQFAEHRAPVASGHDDWEFVTMHVAGQLFGISVLAVQDVLRGLKVTRIPLASREIAGSLNLRGRIVTAIDVRQCLNLPRPESQDMKSVMSVVVEHKNEFFSLIVDTVGEVINLPRSQMEKSPSNLSGRWKDVASGVYKLEGELLIILDVQKLLKF